MSARVTPSGPRALGRIAARCEVGALRQRPDSSPGRSLPEARRPRSGGLAARLPGVDLDRLPRPGPGGPTPTTRHLASAPRRPLLRPRGRRQVVSVTDGGGAFPELSRRQRLWLARTAVPNCTAPSGYWAWRAHPPRYARRRPRHEEPELAAHSPSCSRQGRRNVVCGDLARRRTSRPRIGRPRGRRGCRTYRSGAAGVSDLDVALGRPGRRRSAVAADVDAVRLAACRDGAKNAPPPSFTLS